MSKFLNRISLLEKKIGTTKYVLEPLVVEFIGGDPDETDTIALVYNYKVKGQETEVLHLNKQEYEQYKKTLTN